MFYQTITSEEAIGRVTIKEMTVEKIRVAIAVEDAKRTARTRSKRLEEKLKRDLAAQSRRMEYEAQQRVEAIEGVSAAVRNADYLRLHPEAARTGRITLAGQLEPRGPELAQASLRENPAGNFRRAAIASSRVVSQRRNQDRSPRQAVRRDMTPQRVRSQTPNAPPQTSRRGQTPNRSRQNRDPSPRRRGGPNRSLSRARRLERERARNQRTS